ncbi:hypothetical protein, partial [Mesorhizobium sp.]|uniref:hypothetical protein n=1 Tax=Mesorhizobium sp. TaxID=1871066 RepID=UPI0025F1E080
MLAISLCPFASAALLTGLKSGVRYHGRHDKTRFALLSLRSSFSPCEAFAQNRIGDSVGKEER